MGMTVKDFLMQNTSITDNIHQFTPLIGLLNDTINQIDVAAEVQTTNKTGIAKSKVQLKNNLIAAAFETGSRICSFALINNDMALFNEVNIKDFEMKRCSGAMLVEWVQLIYDRAEANKSALIPYGINDTVLTNLRDAINNYVSFIPKPRLGIAERRQATLQLKLLFETLTETLQKLDFFVYSLKYSEANFFNGYKSCRKIVDKSSRTLALKAKVIDGKTLNGVKGAKITFKNTNARGKKAIIKETAEKGGIMVKSLTEGKYKVTVSATGYETSETEIYVSNSELCRLEVALDRKMV